MTTLIVSIVALFLGPALLGAVGSSRRIEAALDGFVLVAIGGIVLFELLPESFALGGTWAIAAGVAGFFIPMLAEHTVLGFGRGGECSRFVLNLALIGLGIHAFLDGIALTEEANQALHHAHGGDEAGAVGALALGVVLHRLPVGLAIWSVVRPGRGRRSALLLLGLISVFTVTGYGLGPESVSVMPMAAFGVFQALVAGSLVHVVFHRPRHTSIDLASGMQWPACLGALAAVAVLVMTAMGHDHGEATGAMDGVGDTFLTLALASAPALVLAFVAGGLLKVYLPMHAVRWLSRGGPTRQALKGMGFGLPLPVCSCGVVPLYQSLVTRGVPPAAGLAFLVATPELGVDALLVSLPLLGAEMTMARLVCAAIVAVVVALVVSRWMPANEAAVEPTEGDTEDGTGLARLRKGLTYGFENLVDDVMPWILAGLAIAAVANPLLSAEWIREIPAALEIPLFALIGMPVYVCAAGATPIVAVLLLHSVSPGAAVAFLLTGPATNLTTYGVLSDLHGRRTAVLFGVAVAAAAIAVGYGTNAFFGGSVTSPLGHDHGPEGTLLQMISLGLLGLAFLWSLLRQGPREQLARILPSGANGADPCHEDDDEGDDADGPTARTADAGSCCEGS
jgi:uncharacterized membrane protein YraQ (UPF0718 family)